MTDASAPATPTTPDASAPRLITVGLMSGTSLDGVDAAILTTDGTQIFSHGPALTLPYSPALRTRLRALLDEATHCNAQDAQVLAAEQALTDVHVQAVLTLCDKAGGITPDLIGFHGQTILHEPGRTWQIGDAARLSAATNTPVIHDFRSADVQAGGEGAPLAPLYHAALLHGQPAPVAVLNIGGVANMTLLTQSGDVLACDTGPGNALLDDWTFQHTGQRYDQDGALSLRGTVNPAVLERLLDHPFFSRPAPKSLDRLSFHKGLDYLAGLSPEDGAATLVAFTAETVARTPLPAAPQAWFVCGGGRHNPALMAALRQRLAGTVQPVEALGWDGDALEAECFGFLAARSLLGLPLSLPTTTGVPRPLTGGRLTCGGLAPSRFEACARLMAHRT
ncbi:anhydro-N-acetylmuramic acid kinase [Acetobacter senegalensis]|uniref:anhydro-N-acetylmuramic acid kinase n=1 Tax=Acetobacter senegalensis TaxID=446692 RepID=UPI0038D17D79